MKLKQQIRGQLEKLFDKQYEKKLKRYQLSYGSWLSELSKAWEQSSEETNAGNVFPGKGVRDRELKQEYELLQFGEGKKAEGIEKQIEAYLSANPNVQLLYTDEDMETEDGILYNPWLKPDWSPDSYLCRDYLGSLLAVRKSIADKLTEEERMEEGLCHDRLVTLAGGFERGAEGIGHLKNIGFHRKKAWLLPGEGRPGNKMPDVGIKPDESGNQAEEPGSRTKQPSGQSAEPIVSVIIPSKDNSLVLARCLQTLWDTVHHIPYEIIVVDNGSSQEAKFAVEATLNNLSRNITINSSLREVAYCYKPMEFNFSKMCNMGAAHAGGKLLLFLNDDIEAVEQGWLELMAEKAVMPWAGAVGMKLLYPDGKRIQHAGITNIRIGPMHKLQYHEDNTCYYDGRNTGIWNVLGVTGACLMLRKELFLEVGGFAEQLRVAFNDVDLCYTLYGKGLHNIVINTMHLLHHESLSRGYDDETKEKRRRLLEEREKLYERHPDLEERDPYYHPWLNCTILDTDIKPAYEEGRIIEDKRSCVPAGDLSGVREDNCVRLGVELASAGRTQGYILVLGSDNACYSKKLLFKDRKASEKIYEMSFTEQYRADIVKNVPDQKNVALSGFKTEFTEKLPEGEYQIGAIVKDRISGARLLNWSTCTMIVK